MEAPKDGPDDTSIKPVSSLRSRFEGMGKDAEPPRTPTAGPRQPSLAVPRPAADQHSSPSPSEASPTPPASGSHETDPVAVPRKRGPTPPQPRPKSMMAVTPTQKSPPMVTVDSPQSPPKGLSIDLRLANGGRSGTATGEASPNRPPSRSVGRTATPGLQQRMSAFMQDTQPLKPAKTGSDAVQPAVAPKLAPQKTGGPPPVNRAAKPKMLNMNASTEKPTDSPIAPEKTTEVMRPAPSPFNTPPPSGESSPGKAHMPGHGRTDSDVSSLQHFRGDSEEQSLRRIRTNSDASFVQRIRGESDASYADRARAGSDASFVESSSLSGSPKHFDPPPVHHHVAARRDHASGLSRTTMPARYRHSQNLERSAAGDFAEDRPRLPARPELQVRSGRISPNKQHFGRDSPPKARSGRTSPSKLVNHITARHSAELPHRSKTVHDSHASPRIPAVKPGPKSALDMGFDRTNPIPAPAAVKNAPTVPAPRRSMDRRPQAPALQIVPPMTTNGHSHDDEEDAPLYTPAPGQTVGPSEFPDSSNVSRRPPRYRRRPFDIFTDYDTRLVAVCGEYVCTTGYLTKAWNLRTGELMLNMAHGDNIKVTAITFKPAASIDDEGQRVWLGTSMGEIHEVDIPSQSLVKTKANAHRREIIRMYRHISDLWTLDDGGELNVWRRDARGVPNLDAQPYSLRTVRGHTFSIAAGEHLWIATGKDIRVYAPGARSEIDSQVLRNPLNQPNTGDITSGAIITSKPDFIYFGHTDGKVSIYNRRDFSCAGVVNVSVYKISSLAGVGDYLWAGYNTGMAYVYDTSTTPWKVKKDWHAHGRQICSIVADPSAVWKLDRLQVVTLGTDNMLRLWDGLLEEDWLHSRMQEHDSEYCSFDEISVAVLTWNAGASKPGHLQYNKQDDNFFREYMTSNPVPDVFVFGFQELVDLEDKKVTAKSFFKSKKKDSSEQEHMSHQYRAWRDHLTRCLEDYIPGSSGYALLHTASMVGLFTCVFVKSPLRPRIKNVHTAEIKRGMGGLHGNKGALVLRFTLDDTSLCFLNCHLAAGQTQTINRNNDIAAILEAEALPPNPLSQTSTITHADVFTSGGDGSMVLDHEVCILNGDLNYRIDTMGRDTVIKHVAARNLPRLLERDQLLLSRKKNPGFRLRAFAEAPINFAPTYKYNVQTDEYDTSEKRRAPAWCDRVLYRGLGKVRCEEYRRWELRVSDHRPVSARLRVRVKKVRSELREGVWERCGIEFEWERGRVGKGVQLDYLTNVLGFPQKEAAAALHS